MLSLIKFACRALIVFQLYIRGSRSAGFNEADLEYTKQLKSAVANTSDLKVVVSSSSNTNTYAQAVNYGKTHPTRDGESWSGWCASLMWRSGNLPEGANCPSAIDCYRKSHVVSFDYMSAPSGAFHWWDIGSDGHVAMATTGGWAMMASCHIEESWGDCIGQTPVSHYTSTTGGKYLGWSYDYNNAEIADVHGNTPNPTSLPRSSTQESGVPDTYYYMRQQTYASFYGYTGPIDGELGENSWAGGLLNYFPFLIFLICSIHELQLIIMYISYIISICMLAYVILCIPISMSIYLFCFILFFSFF